MVVALVGCSDSDNKSPEDIIKGAYGDKEFKISFSMDTINEPIEDIKYSAKSIPLLPTPVRIGYIFEGWFFDREYTMPYTDRALLMTMSDVTLYAKWHKEEFVNNGAYDIEYKAELLEDTLKKGPLAGDFTNFTECINIENTFLEKSDKKLMLRIEYDGGVVEPFASKHKAISVILSNKNDTNISIADRIDSLVTSVKTIFIDITNVDISKPIYLDITTYDYSDRLMSEEEIEGTFANYVVQFEVTKIIGLSEAYADPSIALEEGYYLAKSYLRKEDNDDSMAGQFNPVYSYIYSDGKSNYKLIKQNIPYTGMVRPLAPNITDNYFDRIMSFVPMLVYYDIPEIGHQLHVDSDYYPKKYKGGEFRPLEIEFHKDTGKVYNIFDLGHTLDKQYMVQMAVTGFMEVVDGMGYMNMIMTIDYDTLFKLSDCDYEPLRGEAYKFHDEMMYYPGYIDDLDEKNLTKDALLDGGFSVDMINFFFDSSRQIYDSKITITPKAGTNDKSVANSRYDIKHFDIDSEVFGYNPKNGKKLIADTSKVQTFSDHGSEQLRQNVEKRNGRSVHDGATIRFADEFREKVDKNVDFGKVSWTAYDMKNGVVDYNSPIALKDPVRIFSQDFAVYFEYRVHGEDRVALLEFVKYEAPHISVMGGGEMPINWVNNGDNLYTSDYAFKMGESVPYPLVAYNFMGKTGKIVDFYYQTLTEENVLSVDPTCVVAFSTDNRDKLHTNLSGSHSDSFTLAEPDITYYYEISNLYGEREYLRFHISTTVRNRIEVKNEHGEIVETGSIVISDGERKPYDGIINKGIISSLTADMVDKYTFNVPDYSSEMVLTSYSVFTPDKVYENILMNSGYIDDINEKLHAAPYGYAMLTYQDGEDIINAVFLYNFTFDGLNTYVVNDYKTFFTDRDYIFKKLTLVGHGGDRMGNSDISVEKIINGVSVPTIYNRECSIDKRQYEANIKFLQYGDYNIVTRYYINGEKFCNNPNGIKWIEFVQRIKVVDIRDEVTIKYVTDEKHPFKDGTLENVKKYNLKDDIWTLDHYEFDNALFDPERKTDVLFGWSESGTLKGGFKLENTTISNFISSFNNNNVTLHAIWDPQIKVKYVYEYPTTHEIKEYTTKTISLDKYGRYVIPLHMSLPDDRLPIRYNAVGWTGGMLGDVETTRDYYLAEIPTFATDKEREEYFTIHAVVKREISVKYQVDKYLSIIRPGWDTINEGDKLPDLEGKDIIPMQGYTFKGWRLATSVDASGKALAISNEPFDIAGPITLDMVNYQQGIEKIVVLVAVFEDADSNEVWQKEVTP